MNRSQFGIAVLLSAAVLATPARRASADVILPSVTESIRDDGGLFTFNAPPFEGLIRHIADPPNGPIDDRAIVQFDLTPYAGVTLAEARLDFTLFINNSGGDQTRVFQVSAFQGTGAPDLGDFAATSVAIGQVQFDVANGGGDFSLDALGALGQVLGSGGGFLAIRFEALDANSFPSIVAGATLTVTAVPEPASVALLGGGAAGLLGFARRRKAADV